MNAIHKNLENKLNKQRQRYIDELQLIDELEANFNTNNWIKARKEYLLNKLK